MRVAVRVCVCVCVCVCVSQDLLKEHLVVVMFLTMLVGAGGNAGNQSAIKVIRGLVSVCVCLCVCLWASVCNAHSAVLHFALCWFCT